MQKQQYQDIRQNNSETKTKKQKSAKLINKKTRQQRQHRLRKNSFTTYNIR